jgi:hypothetical protein
MPTSILLRAQEDLPYRSLKSLNNDTIQYLDYNFFIRHAQYEGKKISDFIKDLELPIVYVDNVADIIPPKGDMVVGAVILGVRKGYVSDFDVVSEDYYVSITFVKTIPFDDFNKVTKYSTRKDGTMSQWTPQLQELLKDIEIKYIGTNMYLIKERREALNKSNYREELKKVVEKETKEWQLKSRTK